MSYGKLFLSYSKYVFRRNTKYSQLQKNKVIFQK